MISVIQRVNFAEVKIGDISKSSIQKGLLILLGVAHNDVEEDVIWLSQKMVNLRIFNDEEGKMNLSVKDVGGDILLVSQFTLHAQTKKGNRPSFIGAARPEIALALYEKMINQLRDNLGKPVFTGEFGADMKVSLMNDGPVTIILDSKNRI